MEEPARRMGLPREPAAVDLTRLPEAVLKRGVVVNARGDLRNPVESVCGLVAIFREVGK